MEDVIKKEQDKKGELLNQLAIVSDLIEKANVKPVGQPTLNFELNKEEYEKVSKYLEEKSGGNLKYSGNKTMGIIIGEVKMVFNLVNKNSV